jgi:hypothetical protein
MKLCKKLVLCVLAVAVVLLCFVATSQTADAAGANTYQYEYDPEKGGYYITYIYGDNPTGKVELPGSYNGQPVIGIKHGLFAYEQKVTSVTIPYGVKDIGDNAFYFCTELRTVTIPSTVTRIGYGAFEMCDNLKFNIYDNAMYLGNSYNPYYALIGPSSKDIASCTIHPNAVVIADRAFYGCKNLASVTLSNSLKAIGNWAFRECTSLTNIVIPNSVTFLGDQAFYGCTGLTSVTIGTGLKQPGEEAFAGCSGITEAIITKGATTIGDGMFAGWSSLKSIEIPDTVTSIGVGAFSGCNSLDNVVIPKGVKTIEDYAFSFCESLTNITIPDSVTSIGEEAFCYCTSLTHFTIPSGVTSIEYCAFSFCTSLRSVTVSKSNISVDPSAFGPDPLKQLIFAEGVKKITGSMVICETPTVVIPTSVTSIEDSAFNRGYDFGAVIYCGTQEQWDAIAKGANNENLTNAPLQFHNYENYMCTACKKYAEGQREYRLDNEELVKEPVVYVNGLPCEVQKDENGYFIEAPIAGELLVVTYTYNEGDGQDVHTQYPTGMKVYLVKDGTVTYIPELDNLLQYSGSSIRITGKKGIRMITSIEKNKKSALTGKGLAGYTLVEYGTTLCFANEIPEGDGLVLGRSYARSNYAYKKNVADPVFATTKDLVQYTNVLVGFSLDQCKDDIAMRPYIILKNANGEQFTLYGGTIYRSIGYIAYQNRNVFQPKTASYNYVWEIIHHVYGDKYDADYKG